MIWNTWKLLYEKRLLSLNRATKAYNLGQNCWDTSERMRTLTLQTSYNNKSFPLSPLSMLLCHQNSPDETSVLPNNNEWGEGGGKAFLQSCRCFHTGKSRNAFAFVSTSFVQDCRTQFYGNQYVIKQHLCRTVSMFSFIILWIYI